MRRAKAGGTIAPAPQHSRPARSSHVSSVCVVGNGYVGTVVAACLARLGRRVVGLETDAGKLRALRSGRAPSHEPDLDELLSSALQQGTLAFTDEPSVALSGADVVFLCVGSPRREDGSVDLEALEAAGTAVRRWGRPGQVLVIKSTVPVGTSRRLTALVNEGGGEGQNGARSFSVVSNPEFLRQGSAVQDFLHPDRIVVGGGDTSAVEAVVRVYRPILDQSFPGGDQHRRPALVRTTSAVAEAAKYASNAFLAAKVSLINEIANICDRVGADVTEVARAMGLDHRIGPEFLQAGLGWGGSCFGKDLDALIVAAREVGYQAQLLEAVRAVNERQRDAVVSKLRHHLRLPGAHVALLGLSFKPGTDDLRGAPSVQLAQCLTRGGTRVTAFDPVVQSIPGMPQVAVADDPYEAADEADAVVLVTDWPELRELDLGALRTRMRGDLLVDGRNAFDPQAAVRSGFVYEGMGRGATGPERNAHGHTAEHELHPSESATVAAQRAS